MAVGCRVSVLTENNTTAVKGLGLPLYIFTSFIQPNATNNSKVTLLLLFVTTTFGKAESNVLSMLHLCVIKMTKLSM